MNFAVIKVDGNDISEDAYTKEAGSVIIKLQPQYLETLSEGQHTLTAVFDDGDDPTVSFRVVAEGSPTRPGQAREDGCSHGQQLSA
ncbi:MAG: hypothetical protein IJM49_00240 [Firmicutes bacterium]|nr:hypothetical protein [Bacillota bacterium]